MSLNEVIGKCSYFSGHEHTYYSVSEGGTKNSGAVFIVFLKDKIIQFPRQENNRKSLLPEILSKDNQVFSLSILC